MIDPVDEFLNLHHFYRKTVNSDSSNLFRVISEQMYDTQNHHRVVRLRCIAYMEKKRDYFKKFISGDFDKYIENMALPTTYGSLVELQAIALMFGRNVIIFKKFDMGNYFVSRQYFTRTFLIFQWSKRSFSTIFTKSTFTNLSICQSICYDILYKDVLKYPDVDLAVEKMLRPENLSSMDKYEVRYNNNGYAEMIYFYKDGRSIQLDGPEKTQCVLKNSNLCHFHMGDCKKFSKYLNVFKFQDSNDKRDKNTTISCKFNSCVFQLIMQGYSPIPYKAALGLAPDKYYNIEINYSNNKTFPPHTPRNVSKHFHYKRKDAFIKCECKELLTAKKPDKVNKKCLYYENPNDQIQHQQRDHENVSDNFVAYALVLFSLTLISQLWEYFFM